MNTLSDVLLHEPGAGSTPIVLVQADEFDDWQCSLSEAERTWLVRQSFTAQPGEFAWLEQDGIAKVISGWDGKASLATLGHLPMSLPEGDYHLESTINDTQVLGWALGSYQFTNYKPAKRQPARLFADTGDEVRHTADAVALGRDLINTPAEDMKPSDLSGEIVRMAEVFNASLEVSTGDELLELGARTIHTVGGLQRTHPSWPT